MNESDFEGLMRGLNEARRFARGKPVKGMKIHVPDETDVGAIRALTGLTQNEFAGSIGVSIATLRNWEQGRRRPVGPARVLLALLARHPNVVAYVLPPR